MHVKTTSTLYGFLFEMYFLSIVCRVSFHSHVSQKILYLIDGKIQWLQLALSLGIAGPRLETCKSHVLLAEWLSSTALSYLRPRPASTPSPWESWFLIYTTTTTPQHHNILDIHHNNILDIHHNILHIHHNYFTTTFLLYTTTTSQQHSRYTPQQLHHNILHIHHSILKKLYKDWKFFSSNLLLLTTMNLYSSPFTPRLSDRKVSDMYSKCTE